MLAGHVDVAMPARTGRVVYPYSVVPGGVRTPEELRAITEHDRLVAKHYSGFDFRKAKVIALKRPALMYLSYRMRDKIFWTEKTIALPQGEKLSTDGRVTAPTRSANRVDVLAQAAIAPDEPLAEQCDDPFAEGGSATKVDFPGNFQSALNERTGPTGFGGKGPPQSPISQLFGPGGGGGFPPGVFPPPIPGPGTCTPTKPKHGHPETAEGSSKKKKNPCAPGGPPPATVPEPGKPSGLSRGTPKPSSEHADGKILLLCPKPVNAHFWCSCGGLRDKWNLPFHTGKCKPTPGGVALTFAISRLRLRRRH